MQCRQRSKTYGGANEYEYHFELFCCARSWGPCMLLIRDTPGSKIWYIHVLSTCGVILSTDDLCTRLKVFTVRWSISSYRSLHGRSWHRPSHTLYTMASLSTRIVIRATNRELDIPTGLFINNEFVPSADSPNDLIQYDPSHLPDNDRNLFEPCSLVNPATEETICSVAAGKFHCSHLLH